ncbi:Hypothetical predicted protein [Lecanosticta acicola]|uniref:Vacuolar ATPase assembly protein VMA22 n=1 Tax=Lecanosticta acicola TaxID=111012 RepID=A0AAI8Z9H9_9PEZI|nr:Hypothetical predicted protein [Lecanosticta acicola]
MNESKPRTAEMAALHDQMDALWTRYLHFLDEYTSTQETIKKELSSGFFSLTQANFQSAGRRYGQDYYDDRAVASLRFRVVEDDEHQALQIVKTLSENTTDETSNSTKPEKEGEAIDATSRAGNRLKEEPTQLLSPSPTPEPETAVPGDHSAPPDNKTEHGDSVSPDGNSESKVDVHDPLRWFGILVPPTLRSAQKSFSSAIGDECGVAKAVNAARGLRDAEVQIRKLRKVLKKAERGLQGNGERDE